MANSKLTPSTYQQHILEWIDRGAGHGCINAVAGSGKTTTLLLVAQQLEAKQVKIADVKIIVFGKANAQDLIEKFGVKWKGSISTLHSAGWQLVKAYFQNRNLKIDSGKYRTIAQSLKLIRTRNETGSGSLVRSRAIADDAEGEFVKLLDLARLTCTEPTPTALEKLADHHELNGLFDFDRLAKEVTRCLKLGLTQAKQEGIFDFSDQIYFPHKLGLKPIEPYRYVLVDECQDLNTAQLELVKSLAGDLGRILAVGDPCQPPETKVLKVVKRPRGRWKVETEWVEIKDLKVGDYVYSYSPTDGHFYCSSQVKGITERPYSGELVVVRSASGKMSKYTPNHHCIASFAPFRDGYCVYLMQKDDKFRIGMSGCSVGSAGTGPVMRLRQERGDALWILEVHPTKEQAYIREQAIAGKFGLPQLVFNDEPIATKGLVDEAWDFIGTNFERAKECAEYFGRNLFYPLFKSGNQWQYSLKRPIRVHAANLIDGCLMLPFTEESNPKAYAKDWEPISITKEEYAGSVFSLDVEKYHTYVADGIVTHNCQAIFGFAGADNESYRKIVGGLGATELPLSTCYRCPTSHIDLVKAIFTNIPIAARADAAAGKLAQIEEDKIGDFLMPGDLVICRKTAPLVALCLRLIGRGIAATVKGRDIGAQISRELDTIVKTPGYQGYSTLGETIATFQYIQSQRLSGAKNEEQLKLALVDRCNAVEEIYAAHPECDSIAALKTAIETIFSDRTSPITLATAHRTKGLEAERIFIYQANDLPLKWKTQLPWQLDQEYNLLYVALTRSKQELYLIAKDNKPIPWLPAPVAATKQPSQSPLLSPALAASSPPLPSANATSGSRPSGFPTRKADAIALRSPQRALHQAARQDTAAKPTDAQIVDIDPSSFDIERSPTQVPGRRDPEVVADYAEKMSLGTWDFDREDSYPLLFVDANGDRWIADGHHTIEAGAIAKVTLKVTLKAGTMIDAKIYSFRTANRFHGHRISNAQKRSIVAETLKDRELLSVIARYCGGTPEDLPSDRAIADYLKDVSFALVKDVADELAVTNKYPWILATTKIGLDGKKQTVKKVRSPKPEAPVLLPPPPTDTAPTDDSPQGTLRERFSEGEAAPSAIDSGAEVQTIAPAFAPAIPTADPPPPRPRKLTKKEKIAAIELITTETCDRLIDRFTQTIDWQDNGKLDRTALTEAISQILKAAL